MSAEKERRQAGGRRTPIKTIVEIGAGEGGAAAFEAESVDVTTSGMHVRTAYLPEIGEPLMCRFEVNGKEVVVAGEVAWRNEEACGGDFGVRFSEVDAESLATLRGLSGEQTLDEQAEAAEDEPGAEAAKVQRGTRVRLHIDGLASPMKARVRDATTGEVMVGSNLEFLKLGRPLELENIDADDKRGARIERVNIEIDPSTRIPQLVVSLRYLDAASGEEQAPASASPRSGRKEPARAAAVMGSDDDDGMVEEEDEDLARKAGRPEALWNRIKQVGPVFAQFGGKAKTVMNGAIGKAREWKENRAIAAESRSSAPRRVTSPAPTGALRSGGRKGVVRDEQPSADEPVMARANPLARLPKKPVAIGLAALVVLITIFAIAARKPSANATAAAPEASASAAAEGALPELAGLPPAAAPGGAVVANVPLFGPTPMSTNEPVAMPSAPAAPPAAATPPPDGDKLAAAAAAAGEGEGDDSSGDAAGDDSGEDNDKPSASASSSSASKPAGAKSFTRGKVKNPVVLSLRMTDNVKGVRGVPTATGFTVHVSGAQSKDPAAGLMRKDSRIASIKVSNKGDGADLTVQFKDGVPAYSVRGSGSNLTIALGRGDAAKDAKKTAKADTKKSNKKSKGGKKH